LHSKGGQRKAVIFTESVRTQRYLADLLSANGYDGQIVLLNGQNSGPASRAIYEDWLARHKSSDAVSGSRSADMKAAVAVLPYDVERRSALVVRLFRAPVLVASGEEMSEEACAGMIENEDADTTARREAYEELGVDLPSLEFVARVWSSPGVSTERQVRGPGRKEERDDPSHRKPPLRNRRFPRRGTGSIRAASGGVQRQAPAMGLRGAR